MGGYHGISSFCIDECCLVLLFAFDLTPLNTAEHLGMCRVMPYTRNMHDCRLVCRNHMYTCRAVIGLFNAALLNISKLFCL